jgi:signal transduction histidine kinase
VSEAELRARLAALEAEVAALRETRQALMNRVERGIDEAGSAFHLFESNILLRRRVEERTAALSRANAELLSEIGERKKVEVELVRAKEAAEGASRAKSEFLAHMSHELRTPLNGVMGMASLLLRMDLGPQELECARTIQTSAESLLGMINGLLDLAKVEAGKMRVDPTVFEVSPLLADVVHLMQPAAREQGLTLQVTRAPGLPRAVFGDRGRLRQVLLNLLSNAVKFTPAGRITLRVRRAGQDALHFEVEDTGIGIPAEKHDLVFQAFTQADPSTTRRYGGTGLGLTISQRLVQLMGGEIGLASAPGVGSKFSFTLPLPLRLLPRAQRQLRVLVVAEATVDRQVAQRMLERLACEVEAVAGVEAGAVIAAETQQDVVLVDWALLREAPREAQAGLTGPGPDAERPWLVAFVAPPLAADPEREGADDHLAKPLELGAVHAMLRRAQAPGG